MPFSDRLPAGVETNAISRAVAALRGASPGIIDLTESNPTRVGLPYPDDMLAPLGAAQALSYEPHPFGLATAREAVARDFARRGAVVDPGCVVLSASTSESYSWLFKLLCNPGDVVAVPQPSYPLFEHLTRLEGIGVSYYGLQYHGRWEIDFASVAAAPANTRAMLVVSPNNPTGSYLASREFDQAVQICRERGWALVADEVFADYPLDSDRPTTDLATRADVLAFTLGGASKLLGLPQVKLGWMAVGGPAAERRRALDALELIADTFLSVGTPVQIAAGELLAAGAAVREAIHGRIRRNLSRARELVRDFPACDVLRVEGGWTAPLRVPATRTEEEHVLRALAQARVLVHPGYFFDFPHEAFLVVSLLPPEELFAEALERLLRVVNS